MNSGDVSFRFTEQTMEYGLYRARFTLHSPAERRILFVCDGSPSPLRLTLNDRPVPLQQSESCPMWADVSGYLTPDENRGETIISGCRKRADFSFVSVPAAYFVPYSATVHVRRLYDDRWECMVRCMVRHTGITDRRCHLSLTVGEGADEPNARAVICCTPGVTVTAVLRAEVETPALWSMSDPHITPLTLRLTTGIGSEQTVPLQCGFRELVMDPDLGCFLNGERIALRGAVCEQELSESRLIQLRAAGYTLLCPNSRSFTQQTVAACDRLGILTVGILPDEGNAESTPYLLRCVGHPSHAVWYLPAGDWGDPLLRFAERRSAVWRIDPGTPIMCDRPEWVRECDLLLCTGAGSATAELHRERPELCLLHRGGAADGAIGYFDDAGDNEPSAFL